MKGCLNSGESHMNAWHEQSKQQAPTTSFINLKLGNPVKKGIMIEQISVFTVCAESDAENHSFLASEEVMKARH